MGMRAKGSGRLIWIRLLILVLALTASRSNFPLFKLGRSSSRSDSTTLSARTPGKARKSEGVRPSRRHVETRRADSLQNAQTDSAPRPETFVHAADLLCSARGGLQPDADLTRCTAIAQPDYLQFFRRTDHVSTLPPPL